MWKEEKSQVHGEHSFTHAPDPEEVEMRGIKRKIVEKAEITRDNPRSIIGEVLASASDSAHPSVGKEGPDSKDQSMET